MNYKILLKFEDKSIIKNIYIDENNKNILYRDIFKDLFKDLFKDTIKDTIKDTFECNINNEYNIND